MKPGAPGFRLRAGVVVGVLVVCGGFGLTWTVAGAYGGGLGPFVLLFAAFHLVEFFATWAWRRPQLSMTSFAFNGRPHALAVSAALAEYGLEAGAWSSWGFSPVLRNIGIALALVGMAVRIWAMVAARGSFNHIVQTALPDEHRLIESGPYRWLRHPSYTGFYWYSIGTQVALLNPVVLVLYAVALAAFFRNRIPGEEAALLRHFGARYESFRRSRRLLIPAGSPATSGLLQTL